MEYMVYLIPTNPPKNLEDFSTISVFGTPEDMTKKKPPLGPYVTNTNIKLSKGEWELLSRNPKYSVKYPPMRMAMATRMPVLIILMHGILPLRYMLL